MTVTTAQICAGLRSHRLGGHWRPCEHAGCRFNSRCEAFLARAKHVVAAECPA
jgi:hypothetical protein